MPRIYRLVSTVTAALLALAVLPSNTAFGQAGVNTGGQVVTREQKLAALKDGALQYFEGGKYAEAIKRMEEFLSLLTTEEKSNEKQKVCYLLLAECYYRLGKEENFTKAISYWSEFLRIWPADPLVLQVKSAVAGTYTTMKKWKEALEWWPQVEQLAKSYEAANLPEQTRIYGRDMRENALSAQAYIYKQIKQPEDEITVLERLVYPEITTPVSAEGAVRLMSLYALKHDPADPATVKFADKAVELLKSLQSKTHLVENFIALNSIAIKLGDDLLDVHAYKKALEAYWAVRPRDVVAQMQKDRIKAIQLRADQLLAAAKGKPIETAQANRTIDEVIKPRLEESKKILAEFEKVPDFMPSLYFRLARCQADMNKKWEAIVVFNQILDDYPNTPLRELVVFSRLALYVDLNVPDRSYRYCDEYLKEFPTGAHAAEVLYLRGIAAMRAKDWYMGEKYFDEAVKGLSDLPERTEAFAKASADPKIKGKASELKQDAENHKGLYWRQCRYQIGNARFLENKFDVAQKDFDAFIAEFGSAAGGKGEFMEDAEYQLALCHLFQGHYEKDPDKMHGEDGAIERLQNYLAKWGSQSSYGSDAKYRLAVCRYAAYESEECVKECEEWLKTYGNNKDEILQPEVYALLGDAKAALKQPADAAAAYIESYKRATTDEVLTYSLFEAGKQLQKAGDWEGIDKLYTEFVQKRPEHPAVVTAIYWMGKAKAKLGNLEDAKKLTIETLQKHLANPKMEGVEMILSQLAEWSRRRPPTRDVKVDPDKPQPKWDAEAELARMVKPLADIASPTAQARLAYARGELYRIGRTPEKRVQIIAEITEKYPPDVLSPHLLMETGDYLMSKGEVDRAEKAYRKIKEDFPKCEHVDAGWVGLADVYSARKDFKKAEELYAYAIDRLGAPWKLKEALIGQAKCWLEFADQEKDHEKADALWTKARKQFEEVASVREWRGESTAMALYNIAEIQFRQGKFPEATVAFQRLTDTQGKFPTWVARAYLRAAEGFYRQGKNDLAQKELQKLLDPRDAKGQPDQKKIEKFTGLPELEQARKRLTELGGTV